MSACLQLSDLPEKVQPGAYGLSDGADIIQMASPLCCIQGAQCDCAAHLLNICLRYLRLKQRPASVR